MPKLNRKEFDAKHRFREARKDGIHCADCTSVNGNESAGAFCNDSERIRRVNLAGLFSDHGSSWYAANHSMCDAYKPQPLVPEEGMLPVIHEGQAILLGSQFRDPYHADPNCPYVVEEIRKIASGGQKAGVNIVDISDLVPGELMRAICEMPCCSSKLPYQISMPDTYRQRTGIKPDGTEDKIWVRKIVEHERRLIFTGSVFNLSKFGSKEFHGDTWERIHVAEIYLTDSTNKLGSRPLSEAINPVMSSPHHHTLEGPCQNPQGDLEFWIYDERLFDWWAWIQSPRTPMRKMEMIPEGVIPCVDSEGIFRFKNITGLYDGFSVYGNVKPVNTSLGLPEGVSHFIEIGALSYNHLHNWTSGVFGKGFMGEARGEE